MRGTVVPIFSETVTTLNLRIRTSSLQDTKNLSQAAELFAILHPLLYLTSERIGVKLIGCRVVIISDSKNTCNGLEVEDPLWVKQYSGAHLPLWLSLHALKRHGLTYVVRHVPRDRAFLQKACHDLANIARKSQMGVRDKLGWSDEQLAAF